METLMMMTSLPFATLTGPEIHAIINPSLDMFLTLLELLSPGAPRNNHPPPSPVPRENTWPLLTQQRKPCGFNNTSMTSDFPQKFLLLSWATTKALWCLQSIQLSTHAQNTSKSINISSINASTMV